MVMSPYEILNIPKNCSIEDVKRAFKIQAKKYHPDISKDNGEKFKNLKNAYDYLLINVNSHDRISEKTNNVDDTFKPNINNSNNNIFEFKIFAEPYVYYEIYNRNIMEQKKGYKGFIILEEKDIDITNGLDLILIIKNIKPYALKMKILDLPAPVHNETIKLNIFNEEFSLNIKIKEYL